MDENAKAIYDKITDIQERTARIETHTDRISNIDDKSNKAVTLGKQANDKAENNSRSIKTLWGFISGIIIAFISAVIKYFGG